MKETIITRAVKSVVELKLKAVDDYITNYVEPLLDVGSPEKLINKKYEEWMPEDIKYLSMIYGDKLNDFIFNKSLKEVKEMEEEERKLSGSV
jgi:hypothetical protein